MEYYVYIIQSERLGIYHKGFTSYPVIRLEEHNKGLSRYTADKGPWKMVYLEKMPDKRAVLIKERQIKRANTNYFRWLIEQESNIVSHFI